MPGNRPGLLSPVLAALGIVMTGCAHTPLMTTDDYNALSGPPPDAVIPYGGDPLQFGHLRIPPTGAGPFPVVVVVHGGCWLAEYPLTGTEAMSAALTEAGVATWNIEYRRIGDEGGGWPGTFDDVAAAIDHLRELKESQPLDLDRVVTTGHSAGGHLALWLAARPQLDAGAPGATDPLPVKGVVSLAGATDLVAGEKGDFCGDAIPRLLGGTAEEQPARYAIASPQHLLPLGMPQILLNGLEDPIADPDYSRDYAAAAQSAGDSARYVGIREAGHFELVAPGTPAWAIVESEILRMVNAL